jgi:outer membrane protein OmpA-like peptidoglycan-associated protein/opacity protein-like surface antigen
MYLPVHRAFGSEIGLGWFATGQAGKAGFQVIEVRRNWDMSSHCQNSCGRIAIMLLAMIALLCSMDTLAAAQDQPAPKWELYGGYSAFYAGCDLNGLLPGGVTPVTSCLKWDPRGVGASVTYDFNRWLGLTVDSSGQWGSGNTGVAARIDQVEFFNISAGPKITFRTHYFSPFLEALGGEHRLASEVFGNDFAPGFMAGGGLDVNLGRHFAVRLFRADFVYSDHQYGPSSVVPATDVRGVRLQSGVVFMFGGEQPGPPVSGSCTINPSSVIVGEPVTATAEVNNFNPKHTLNYTWSSTGGQITSKDNTASIDTNGTAGGGYTVTAHISDPKMKQVGETSCMVAFTVREARKNPPVVACSADPSTVQAGTSSTISCPCTSPDKVPVTVGNWTASGGSISSGAVDTAILITTGASPGPITVSANCTDSRGLNTPATGLVLVQNPPQPSAEFVQLEHRLALHSIYFPTDQPRSENPNGGLLVSQEQTLKSLADDFKKYLETKPDAHLILGGHADRRGTVEYNQALSERRVERTKRFLIEHGVPEANLETKALGEQHNLTEDQVKDAIEKNPELTSEQRQKVLANLRTILLASNRRVDITLSTTGQQSIREYPFNAADSLTLLQQEGTRKRSASEPRKKATPMVQQ